MSFIIESARNIFPETLAADVVPVTIARFNKLEVEDKLALIWFAYLEMGKTLSITTPDPVNMQFVSSTLSQINRTGCPASLFPGGLPELNIVA